MPNPRPPIEERKARQAIEGASAMAEYIAKGFSQRQNMERLRRLRMSKEAKESSATKTSRENA